MFRSVGMVCLLLICMPLLWGMVLQYTTKWKFPIGTCYGIGFTAMLAFYEACYLIGRRVGLEFDGVFYVYLVLTIGFSMVAIVVCHYHHKKMGIGFGTELTEKIKEIVGEKAWSLFALLVILQAAILIFTMPTSYSDDITYITIVNDMVEVRRYYPLGISTGYLYPGQGIVSPKYDYTSYYPFVSVLCILTNVHPLILCKSVLPIAYLLMSYGVWYGVAKLFFPSVRMQATFMNFLALLQLFGCYSQFNVTKRLLLYGWNGKAPLATIFIPLLLLLTWNRSMERGKTGFWLLFCLVFGMIATSTMSFGLCAIATALSGLTLSICKKRFIYLGEAAILCLPECLLLGMMLLGV